MNYLCDDHSYPTCKCGRHYIRLSNEHGGNELWSCMKCDLMEYWPFYLEAPLHLTMDLIATTEKPMHEVRADA